MQRLLMPRFLLRRAAPVLALMLLAAAPGVFAQTPASPAPASSETAKPPEAAKPAEAVPAAPPATAQPAPTTPAAPPPAATAQPADPFGEETTLTARPVLSLKGTANWDTAFESITDSFKKLFAALDKLGLKASGAPLVVYTSTDDTGFVYRVEVPVDEVPKTLPKDVSGGKSPEGKVLKFVHRGSYDSMDNTYEAITNHLDDKKLEAQDTFIEEYTTDPLKTAEDKLVINVFVPLKAPK
ncbi:MAG: AraC family transcriptional regulator [Xanthobacteraceae bacterium]|nr:MAG: AraC family transcriptional regulator [Xanthobacteraceae bacterium]